MTYGQVKDVVREHFGRIGWSSDFLDLALAAARGDIEKSGNYYWMRDVTTFNTVAATQTYAIGSGLAINEANFKDIRALHAKETTSTLWEEVPVGIATLEETFLSWATDDDDFPQTAVLDNTTLYLFPTPDAIYNMKLWHYNWTTNPTVNTSSDELTSRFPEALIYGALVRGAEQYDSNFTDADRWRTLFAQELQRIKRHSLERERQDRVSMIPFTGPWAARRQNSLVGRGLL